MKVLTVTGTRVGPKPDGNPHKASFHGYFWDIKDSGVNSEGLEFVELINPELHMNRGWQADDIWWKKLEQGAKKTDFLTVWETK